MKKVRMKALKPMRYLTRRLRAGDEYVCTRHAARVHKALRKAEPAAAVSDKPVAAQVPGEPFRNPFQLLCAEYERLSGALPDRRWGETRLRREIEALEAVAEQVSEIAEIERGDVEDGSPANADG